MAASNRCGSSTQLLSERLVAVHTAISVCECEQAEFGWDGPNRPALRDTRRKSPGHLVRTGASEQMRLFHRRMYGANSSSGSLTHTNGMPCWSAQSRTWPNSISTGVSGLLWSITVSVGPGAANRQLPRIRLGSVGLRETLNSMYWAGPALSFSSMTATTGVFHIREVPFERFGAHGRPAWIKQLLRSSPPLYGVVSPKSGC